MRNALMGALVVLSVACGKSPNDPSNFAQIAGDWSGTLESSNYLPVAFSMNLTQSAGTVTGTWVALSGSSITGTITGTVDKSSFTGTTTFTFTGGPTCNGSLSGSVSTGARTMTWGSPGFTGNCGLNNGNPTSVNFVLQKR